MPNKIPCSLCGALILPITANTTGGICMRCKRHGPPVQSEIVKRAYATPARCVSLFNVSTKGEAIPNGKLQDQSVKFQLACTCGAGEFSILGFPMPSPAYPGQTIFAAPISLSCYACGKTEPLFKPSHDGYDGEIDSSASVAGSGNPSKFLCPKCEGTTHLTAVSLEYSIDDDEMEDWEELAAKPQDFFTWFSLFAKCTKCGYQADVADYECA